MDITIILEFVDNKVDTLSSAGRNFYHFMQEIRGLLTKYLMPISYTKRLSGDEAKQIVDALLSEYWSTHSRASQLLMKMHPDFIDKLYPQLQSIVLEYSKFIS
jgi:hypothetical protein